MCFYFLIFSLTKMDSDVNEFLRFLKYFIKKLMVCPILESTRFKPIFPRVAYPVECLAVISNPNHKEISSVPVYLKRKHLIIPNLSLPPRNKHGVNSGGSPVKSKTYGFLLEFIPMKIGAGMTF